MSPLSNDRQLNRLLKKVIKEVVTFARNRARQIERLTDIGIALSAEKDINRLLEMIVDEARHITRADAGTLYIVDEEARLLRFTIVQNDSLDIRMGGTSGVDISLPPVPLEVDGKPNYANVSSYCALTGETVNIPDVYEARGFDFTGPREYDKKTGYRSQSMLVVPMKNHQNDIIGVLQLLNALDPETGEVIPFLDDFVGIVTSLASQAAVALENAQLIQDLKNLFDSFIRSIAAAIDEKSPYTGGHIRRVTELTMMIARKINETREGPLADVHFSEDELEELRIATWMHDVGKITTPEYLINKSTKLEGIFDRIEVIRMRFELIKAIKQREFLERKLDALAAGDGRAEQLAEMEEAFRAEMKRLDEDLAFIENCNIPREQLEAEQVGRLREIASRTFLLNGKPHPFLTGEEVEHLSVARGSLTEQERKIIENHALMSIKILRELPFPKKLKRVPQIAGGHHERLDGTGYPYGLKAEQLPLQTRIMAIADIFEALTAKDRPYKKPMKLSEAVKILGDMCRAGHIDPDIYNLFIQTNLFREYAEKELNPLQIDVDVAN